MWERGAGQASQEAFGVAVVCRRSAAERAAREPEQNASHNTSGVSTVLGMFLWRRDRTAGFARGVSYSIKD